MNKKYMALFTPDFKYKVDSFNLYIVQDRGAVCRVCVGGGGGRGQRQASLKNLSSRAATRKFF